MRGLPGWSSSGQSLQLPAQSSHRNANPVFEIELSENWMDKCHLKKIHFPQLRRILLKTLETCKHVNLASNSIRS